MKSFQLLLTINMRYKKIIIQIILVILILVISKHNITYCADVPASPLFNALVNTLRFSIFEILKESDSVDTFLINSKEYLALYKPPYLRDVGDIKVIRTNLEEIIRILSKAEQTSANVEHLKKAKYYLSQITSYQFPWWGFLFLIPFFILALTSDL